MVVGIGIDIIEISRIKKAIESSSFVGRVFTEAEQLYCNARGNQRAASYAARFAAKEAFVKALGTGFIGGTWHDIEIVVNEQGRPDVKLTGFFAAEAQKRGIARIMVSLSHSREYAVAQVLAEGGNA